MTENKGKITERSDIAEEFKWRTEDIYPSKADWETDYKQLEGWIDKIASYKDRIGENPETLLECLQFSDKCSEMAVRLYGYAARKKDEDTRVGENQSLFNRINSLITEFSSASSFIVPDILEIPENKLKEFFSANSELAVYSQHIDNITRVRDHVLPAEIERIVALTGEMSNAPNQIFSMLNNADIKYPTIKDENGNEVEVTKSRYYKFMQSKDRRLRKDVFEAFYIPYDNLKNTISATLASNIKSSIFNAKVRKYNSTLETSLDADNISVDVYNNLIKTVSDNLEPMYKYVQLRKKLLGVEELHMYDVYVSIIKDVDLEIPYEEAKETIIKAMAPLGEEYQEILRTGFDSRWVDVYENAGKASGAYSAGIYGVHPYVLMNYNGTLSSMYTLAHEMGHAIHSYMSNKTQPYTYHRYKIFLAEVASTLNENLLMDYLIKNTDNKGVKLAILNHFLEQFRGTIYRQTMFAEFEKIIHDKVENGVPLNQELLGDIFYDLNVKYYGPEMIVDPQIRLEWARIPHFYYDFYVYKYSTGFAAATSLASQIMEEGQPAVDRYYKFLQAGSSDYPLNILKNAGVDMSTPEPIVQALEKFKETVDEVTRLTNE